MSAFIPSIIKSGFANLIGGGSNSNDKPQSSTSEAPKDLNELVDRIMDNPNIDNRTKREILMIILTNLQQNDAASGSTVAGAHVPSPSSSLGRPNNNYTTQPPGYFMPQPIFQQYPVPMQFPAPAVPQY